VNAVALFRLDGSAVIVDQSAVAIREEALTIAAGIGLVRNPAENEAATEALRRLGAVRKTTEATRKELKEPLLDLGRKIDATAKDFLAEVDAEETRIKRITADYQSEILAQQREAERIRRAEQERIDSERRREQERIAEEKFRAEEAIRKAAEAEARAKADAERKAREIAEAEARAKADAERRAREAANAAERAKIQAEQRAREEAAAIERAKVEAESRAREEAAAAERAKAESEAKAKDAELARSLANQQQELAALAPAPVAPRAAGQSAKVVWMHEVTDIWALARVHPGLVKIEPRKAEIAEVINAQAMSGQKPQISGLRIWEDVAVSVRQSKGTKAIDV
jgi:hypothetical protein